MINSGIKFDDSYNLLKSYETFTPLSKFGWINYLNLLLYWKQDRYLHTIQLSDVEIKKLIELLKEK